MNAREPNAKAQFFEFLSRFPAEIVALVKRCLPKLRRAFPGSAATDAVCCSPTIV